MNSSDNILDRLDQHDCHLSPEDSCECAKYLPEPIEDEIVQDEHGFITDKKGNRHARFDNEEGIIFV